MADVEAGGAEVHRATRVRRGHDGRATALPRPSDRRHLTVADRRRQLRLQRRISAACSAAQALVIELDDIDIAGQDTTDGALTTASSNDLSKSSFWLLRPICTMTVMLKPSASRLTRA